MKYNDFLKKCRQAGDKTPYRLTDFAPDAQDQRYRRMNRRRILVAAVSYAAVLAMLAVCLVIFLPRAVNLPLASSDGSGPYGALDALRPADVYRFFSLVSEEQEGFRAADGIPAAAAINAAIEQARQRDGGTALLSSPLDAAQYPEAPAFARYAVSYAELNALCREVFGRSGPEIGAATLPAYESLCLFGSRYTNDTRVWLSGGSSICYAFSDDTYPDNAFFSEPVSLGNSETAYYVADWQVTGNEARARVVPVKYIRTAEDSPAYPAPGDDYDTIQGKLEALFNSDGIRPAVSASTSPLSQWPSVTYVFTLEDGKPILTEYIRSSYYSSEGIVWKGAVPQQAMLEICRVISALPEPGLTLTADFKAMAIKRLLKDATAIGSPFGGVDSLGRISLDDLNRFVTYVFTGPPLTADDLAASDFLRYDAASGIVTIDDTLYSFSYNNPLPLSLNADKDGVQAVLVTSPQLFEIDMWSGLNTPDSLFPTAQYKYLYTLRDRLTDIYNGFGEPGFFQSCTLCSFRLSEEDGRWKIAEALSLQQYLTYEKSDLEKLLTLLKNNDLLVESPPQNSSGGSTPPPPDSSDSAVNYEHPYADETTDGSSMTPIGAFTAMSELGSANEHFREILYAYDTCRVNFEKPGWGDEDMPLQREFCERAGQYYVTSFVPFSEGTSGCSTLTFHITHSEGAGDRKKYDVRLTLTAPTGEEAVVEGWIEWLNGGWFNWSGADHTVYYSTTSPATTATVTTGPQTDPSNFR